MLGPHEIWEYCFSEFTEYRYTPEPSEAHTTVSLLIFFEVGEYRGCITQSDWTTILRSDSTTKIGLGTRGGGCKFDASCFLK